LEKADPLTRKKLRLKRKAKGEKGSRDG
jgi:hypothetical protein